MDEKFKAFMAECEELIGRYPDIGIVVFSIIKGGGGAMQGNMCIACAATAISMKLISGELHHVKDESIPTKAEMKGN